MHLERIWDTWGQSEQPGKQHVAFLIVFGSCLFARGAGGAEARGGGVEQSPYERQQRRIIAVVGGGGGRVVFGLRRRSGGFGEAFEEGERDLLLHALRYGASFPGGLVREDATAATPLQEEERRVREGPALGSHEVVAPNHRCWWLRSWCWC